MMGEFENAMQDVGIVCKDSIIADGMIHRFANNGRGNKDCWYVSFGMAGVFGDWSQGIRLNWNTKQLQSFTPHERKQFQQQTHQAKKALEAETLRMHEETAKSALKEWEALGESGQSDYLDRKAVNPIGIRFGSGFIAVPLRDTTSKLWGFQKIYPDGTKRFLTGGRKRACFHHLGTLKNCEAIYVTEGYATGVSVHMVANQATVIAFDAGNLDPVIGALRKVYPNSPITIAADNDSKKASNTGKEKAETAAKQWNCRVVLPQFKDNSTNPTDFNDLMVLEGKEEVKRQLQAKNQPVLCAVNVRRLLTLDIPSREMILSPIIPEQGLVMLYAPRGVGKTHVALSIAYTVAYGGQMFNSKWQCDRANA